MKKISRIALTVSVAACLALSGCTSEEPTPAPVPDPEQPTQPNNPDPDNPDIPGAPVKDWKGEVPHGFITDVTTVLLPISENGYLTFRYGDEIVMDPDAERDDDWMCGVQRRASENTWSNNAEIQLDGEMADPFENVADYVGLCRQFGFRPKSQFSGFEALNGLPTPVMQGYFCSGVLSWVDIITEKYFDGGHPAGSSMGKVNGSKAKMTVHIMPGSVVFSDWAKGLSLSGLQGPGVLLPVGRGTLDPVWSGYPHRLVDLNITGYPDKPGEYPMTMRMAFKYGEETRVVESHFTIKFVGKKQPAAM